MPPPRPLTPRQAAWLAVATAAALWALLAQGNELWLPPALQPVGHALYRIAYWLTLPGQWLSLQVLPLTDHHVPARSAPMAAGITGVLLALGCEAWRRAAGRTTPAPDPVRRHLLERLGLGLAGLLGLGALGGVGWGVLVEPGRLTVRRYRVPIRGLPAWAEGLRIAQLCDTHYGPYVPLPHLNRAVALANSLDPDLVVLTGDYVHRTERAIPAGIGVFGGLRARWGCLAVLGNHDHWQGAEACRGALRAQGVGVLDRRHVYLGPEGLVDTPSPEALCLAGLGDLWEDEQPVEASFEGVPPDTPRVVLSHNPDYAERIPEGLRVDLMIAGHTHGGQVFVPGRGTPKIPSRYGQKYAGGLCAGPTCPVVVSRGVGMAYLPVRLGVPPEVVEITLVAAPG